MNYEINKTINGNDVPIINISERIKTCSVHNMLMREMQSKPEMSSKSDEPDATFEEPLNYANEDSFGTKLIIGISSRYFNFIGDAYKCSLIQKSTREPGYELGIQDISFELTYKSSPCKDKSDMFSDLFKRPEWDGAYIIPMTWYNLSKCIIELQYGNAHTKENSPLFIHNLPFYKGRFYTRGIRRDELDIHADAVQQQKEMIANLSDKNFFTVNTTESK